MVHRPAAAAFVRLVVHAADSPTKQVDAAWIKAMKVNDVDAVVKC
jgi:hypothetical protein